MGELTTPVYPLCSTISIDDIIIISGGIIKEDEKSKEINIYEVKKKGK